MNVDYVSTRGQTGPLSFEEILLSGLAADGGLFVPVEFPYFSARELRRLRGRSYVDVATTLLWPFVDGFEEAEFRAIVMAAYTPFRHQAVAPLRQLGTNQWLMELYHGPTLAFKDVAMQLLCRLFDAVLERRGQRLLIIGATSGDTGGAAIQACEGREAIDLAMMHPLDRVSDVQRRQMTTVAADNIHNFAVRGTFDDCQRIAKTLLNDTGLRQDYRLSAVNSINWARVMAQIVYYFSAALQVGAPDNAPTFIVPSGNFGNIYAGYVAKRMGLPVNKLVITTNQNDILHRFIQTGSYEVGDVTPTQSPSMDIQVASNFERFLFDLSGRDAPAVVRWMQSLQQQGRFSVPAHLHAEARRWFSSCAVDEATTTATMKEVWRKYGFLVDPHTATGVASLADFGDFEGTQIVLATADPAKFPDAVAAATGERPQLPPELRDLDTRKEYCTQVDSHADAVEAGIRNAMQQRQTLAVNNRIRTW